MKTFIVETIVSIVGALVAILMFSSCGTTGTTDPATQAALAQAEQVALQYGTAYLAAHPATPVSVATATVAVKKTAPTAPATVIAKKVVEVKGTP